MVDRYLMDQGEAILQKLSIPVTLLEKVQEGQDHDGVGVVVQPTWMDGEVVRQGDYLYLPMHRPSPGAALPGRLSRCTGLTGNGFRLGRYPGHP